MNTKKALNVDPLIIMPGTSGLQDHIKCRILTTSQPEEKWLLGISCVHRSSFEDCELTEFRFQLPNGEILSCNIQDIMAIKTYATNAHRELMEYASNGFTDKESEAEVLASCEEMQTIIEMFK